jgi:hypothetical protein
MNPKGEDTRDKRIRAIDAKSTFMSQLNAHPVRHHYPLIKFHAFNFDTAITPRHSSTPPFDPNNTSKLIKPIKLNKKSARNRHPLPCTWQEMAHTR